MARDVFFVDPKLRKSFDDGASWTKSRNRAKSGGAIEERGERESFVEIGAKFYGDRWS